MNTPKDDTPFETSMLKNNCWRVDIFPEKYQNLRLVFKFCTENLEKSLVVKQYNYLLDNHVLGSKNSEWFLY